MIGILLAVLVILLSISGAEAATRGVTVKLKASEVPGAPVAEEVTLYGASHALVIGIDDYTAGWPRLANAVRDAELVADELRRRGFDVTLKTDLNSLELQRTLREFFAIRGQDPEARLLLWFAGHGHTVGGEGFLVPADAPPGGDPAFLVGAIPMRDFGSLVRLAQSKHVLSIFDSCFSGTIFAARAGAAPAAITRKTTKPVRQFLTSGDAGQQVRDDGSFRELFLRALRGDEPADANADGYVTGEEMGLFLSQRMATLTQAAQTPRYGRIHDVRYDQGDFVFTLPSGAAATPAPPAPRRTDPSIEIVFWQSIADSTSPAPFEEYLRQFPNGRFAGLARIKLAALQGGRNEPPRAPAAGADPDKQQLAAVPPVPAPTLRVPDGGAPTPPAPLALPADRVFRDCPGCPEMAVIPAGSFRMGAPGDEPGRGRYEGPVHEVRIARPFAIGRFEVTIDQYGAFVDATGRRGGFGCFYDMGDGNFVSHASPGGRSDGGLNTPGRFTRVWERVSWRRPGFTQTGDHPATCVNWEDAAAYTEWLSARTGARYRLPSEAEWEYAARAGTASAHYWNGGENEVCAHANTADRDAKTRLATATFQPMEGGTADCRDGFEFAAPAGSFAANPFGLHDMLGNVWEWVADCWNIGYDGAPVDGSAWTSAGDCNKGVLRGGAWSYQPSFLRAAARIGSRRTVQFNSRGFRVARDLQ